MVILPMEDPEEITSDEEEESNDPPIQRDDLRNPFWIEDKEVLNGPRGHLKMDEIEFWKGTILNMHKVNNLFNHKYPRRNILRNVSNFYKIYRVDTKIP